MASSTYTLFLTKTLAEDQETYFTENARKRFGTGDHQSFPFPDFPEGSTLHLFQGFVQPPKWLKELTHKIDGISLIKRRSIAGVLFFPVDNRMFAVSFAHGWMLLDDTKFEADFGLKAAINALDPKKLRRLERSNLGDALQAVSQSPFQREFSSFGIDDALDLIRKLSGATNPGVGFDSITGSRSLKISGEFELDDLPGLAQEALELFEAIDYKQTPFRILDSVKPVVDTLERSRLFDEAVASIKKDDAIFELSLPSASDAEGISFEFKGTGGGKSYPDLLLRHYISSMGAKVLEINSETLRKHKIVSHFEDERPSMTMPLQRSLIGSISMNGKQYAINDGQWYRIDSSFKASVESAFAETRRKWDITKPTPPKKHYKGKSGEVESEGKYNARIANELGLVCLDAKLIQVPDVVRSGFEACDIIDVENRRFIHVKKSSRRSNILSHFFKQGSNSARQFKRIPVIWDRLALKLDEVGAQAEADAIRSMIKNRDIGRWSCEFWIADAARKDGDFNIPFFSKITLRDEVTDLRAMEFDVALRFIETQPDKIR